MILDCLEEALSSVVGARATESASFPIVQDLESLVGPDVDLGVNVSSILFHEFEGMTGVSVHVMVPVRSSTVGKEDQNLMDGLGVLGQVILIKPTAFVSETPQGDEFSTYPKHIGIFQVRLRIPLLSMNEMGELGRITDEKDWGVVEYPIEVSFLRLDLDRKSLNVQENGRSTGRLSVKE